MASSVNLITRDQLIHTVVGLSPLQPKTHAVKKYLSGRGYLETTYAHKLLYLKEMICIKNYAGINSCI